MNFEVCLHCSNEYTPHSDPAMSYSRFCTDACWWDHCHEGEEP